MFDPTFRHFVFTETAFKLTSEYILGHDSRYWVSTSGLWICRQKYPAASWAISLPVVFLIAVRGLGGEERIAPIEMSLLILWFLGSFLSSKKTVNGDEFLNNRFWDYKIIYCFNCNLHQKRINFSSAFLTLLLSFQRPGELLWGHVLPWKRLENCVKNFSRFYIFFFFMLHKGIISDILTYYRWEMVSCLLYPLLIVSNVFLDM